MFYLYFFLMVSIFFIYTDIRYRHIDDRVALVAIAGGYALLLTQKVDMEKVLLSTFILSTLFLILLATPFPFGGGDLRYLLLCAPLIEPIDTGWFLLLSGVLHMAILLIKKRSTYAFIPTMFAATLIVLFFHHKLWTFIGIDV